MMSDSISEQELELFKDALTDESLEVSEKNMCSE